MTAAAGKTRTAPARIPDGWWRSHPRYRTYVLFAGTGIPLSLAAIIFLRGISALASGHEAWVAYQATLASWVGLPVSVLLFIGVLFFSIRFLRVGVKIPGVRLGPMPAMGEPVIFVLHFAGLVTLSLIILVVLSGVII